MKSKDYEERLSKIFGLTLDLSREIMAGNKAESEHIVSRIRALSCGVSMELIQSVEDGSYFTK